MILIGCVIAFCVLGSLAIYFWLPTEEEIEDELHIFDEFKDAW